MKRGEVTLGGERLAVATPAAGPLCRYFSAIEAAGRDAEAITRAAAELLSNALKRAGAVMSAEAIFEENDFEEIGEAAVAVLALVKRKDEPPPAGETSSP